MKTKTINFLIIIIISLILYAGCNKTKPVDDKNELSHTQIVENAINNISIPTETTTNLNLETLYNDVVTASWTSSNELVISNSGVVTQTKDDETVILSVSLKYKDVVMNKDYTIKVLKSVELENKYNNFVSVVNNFTLTTDIITSDLTLPTNINDIVINWTSNNLDIISNDGKVSLPDEETTVKMVGKFQLDNYVIEKEFLLTVVSNEKLIIDEINKKIENFTFITETSTDLVLPTNFDGLSITWSSKSISYINSRGEIKRSDVNNIGKLEATFTYKDVSVKKVYEFTILAYTYEEMLELEIATIDIPAETNVDLSLPIYFNFDIYGEWISSDETVITNDGVVTLYSVDKLVTLKVILTKGEVKMEKEFIVNVLNNNSGKSHQILSRASTFDLSTSNNVEIKDNLLVLKEGTLEGVYNSNVIETISFQSLVASWASTSGENYTVELKVSVRINNSWSEFITYYPWGFGLQNKCYDQTYSTVKLVDDEVMVLNSKSADAIKFSITLRRTDAKALSPQFSLASFALNSKSYEYPVDISSLPEEVVYDVPKLYQNEVPSIGNIICSPTTCTMLLKYKGEDFSSFDQYEHRYFALKVREYNSGIYGNWVYNTVGMSSFGYDAYVARMYSIEELVEHLANNGPVGLSVKGQMTSDVHDYYTKGHLIVAIGYRYIKGVLHIVCNDPNVPGVTCMYSVSVMKNTWRNVAYII